MKKLLVLAVFSVLIVSVSSASIFAQSQYDIPSWVKGIAGFWAEDKITDNEFGEGLSFLIDNDIIKVPLIQELQNKISQLEAENSELRSQLNTPTPEPTPLITVTTNQSVYANGATVILSGNIEPYDPSSGKELTFLIISPEGDTVTINQLIPSSDGSFAKSLVVGGPLWKLSGDYIIEFSYGTTSGETVINYVGGEFVGSTPEPEPAEPTLKSISLTPNAGLYRNGDNVLITGQINGYDHSIDSELGLTFVIYEPSMIDIISIGQLTTTSDGSFTHLFVAGGPLWKSTGNYTIEYNFGGTIIQISIIYIS